MGIQAGYGNFGFLDADGLAALICNADDIQDPVLLHPVAGLPEGDVGRDVDHPQLLVGQHHGVFGCLRVVGVNLRVARVMVIRHIDGFLAQGIGNSGVHFPGHGQLDDLFHILEGRLAAQSGGAQAEGLGILRVAGDVGVLEEAQVKYVDDAVLEVCLTDGLDAPNLHVDAGNLFGCLGGVLHGGDVAHHQGAAAVINRFVSQSLDSDLGTVAEGVAHGNAQNRFVHMYSSLYVVIQDAWSLPEPVSVPRCLRHRGS